MVRRINNDDMECVERLKAVLQTEEYLLLSTELEDGTNATMVCDYAREYDGVVTVNPIAVLVTSEVFARLKHPDNV